MSLVQMHCVSNKLSALSCYLRCPGNSTGGCSFEPELLA